MKILTINGRKLLYESYNGVDEYGDYVKFYDPCVITETKCIFFKKKIRTPEFLFTIYWNIFNPSYSKEDWRNMISRKLTEIDRIREIKEGNLI